jgi:hypothetical protein
VRRAGQGELGSFWKLTALIRILDGNRPVAPVKCKLNILYLYKNISV